MIMMEWAEQIPKILSAAMNEQIMQFGMAFGLAALIHAKQVRKEIKAQFNEVTSAINNFATALKMDLAQQSERIVKVEKSVDNMYVRVNALESSKGEKQ